MERRTFILYTDAHVCVYNPVLPWRRRLSQHVGQPLHLTSCLLCCLCIYFSPQLNSLNPMPPPIPTLVLHAAQSSNPTVTPCQWRRANTVGLQQGTWEETETGRIKKWSSKWSLTFFFSFSSWIAPRVSSCLACKSFSCTAGRPLLAAVQLLTLLSPRKRKERRRGGQI